MAEFKLVIGTKDGKTHQKELKSPEADVLFNKRIRDKISGDTIGFPGYEFEITGGSDKAGFPMRPDVSESRRKKIFATSTHGVWIPRKGKKVRKTVAGNMVHENTAQINMKVVKQGKAPLAPAEEKAEEGEKKEAPAEKPAEKAEEKPKAEAAEKKEAKPEAAAKPEQKDAPAEKPAKSEKTEPAAPEASA